MIFFSGCLRQLASNAKITAHIDCACNQGNHCVVTIFFSVLAHNNLWINFEDEVYSMVNTTLNTIINDKETGHHL